MFSMQIGYWSVPLTSSDTNYTTNVDPFIPGAWPHLLRALNWAKQNSLHVILDLHGAPGSQNGYDNSGQLTSNPQWGNGNNPNRTLDIIRFIATTLGGMIDVLELLNEPSGFLPAINNVISDYWKDGYSIVREAAGQSVKVMIMDAFLGVQVSLGGESPLPPSVMFSLELDRLPNIPVGSRGPHGLCRSDNCSIFRSAAYWYYC